MISALSLLIPDLPLDFIRFILENPHSQAAVFIGISDTKEITFIIAENLLSVVYILGHSEYTSLSLNGMCLHA